jgi:Fe-S-cluster containining protein
MAARHFRIQEVPDAEEWARVKHLPRFLQPVEFSLTPCVGCHGHCCYGVVGVTMVEALRMALALTVPIQDIVEVEPVPQDGRSVGKTPPLPLEGGDVTLRVRHTDRHACVFLYHLGGKGRCSIHALRPGICRVYPHSVEWGRRRVSVGTQTLCPVRWLQDHGTRTRMQEDLTRWDQDLADEKRLLRAWQKQDGRRTLEAFAYFAAVRLARRWGVDLPALLAPPRRTLGRPLW